MDERVTGGSGGLDGCGWMSTRQKSDPLPGLPIGKFSNLIFGQPQFKSIPTVLVSANLTAPKQE